MACFFREIATAASGLAMTMGLLLFILSPLPPQAVRCVAPQGTDPSTPFGAQDDIGVAFFVEIVYNVSKL